MRILMLGNSFTFKNDMPRMLSELTGAEVVQHTRGGACLSEHLSESTQLGALTQPALKNGRWDFVILQEMSRGPITAPDEFFRSVSQVCEQSRQSGALPILYATWAYQKDSAKLTSLGIGYEEMYRRLFDAYHEAAARNGVPVADVGRRFYELAEVCDLYSEDGFHPSEYGSRLAAELLAETIRRERQKLQTENAAHREDV